MITRRAIERPQPSRARLGRLALVCAVGLVCLAALGAAPDWFSGQERASAQSSTAMVREGEIGDAQDADWYPLFALAEQTFSLTLQRLTLPAAELTIWKPAHDGEPAQLAARWTSEGVPLIWTAPESGAWRARVVGLNGAVGRYRLTIQPHADAIGANLATARLSSFAGDGTLIERSAIDAPGDVDWFAIPMAAGNRYLVWSLTGSVSAISAAIREPAAESLRDLGTKAEAFSDVVEVGESGLAVLAIRGRETWMQGSYAFGVTRWGSEPEPVVRLPADDASELQIESIAAWSTSGGAEFGFQGSWGPIRTNSGLRVWIDTDPGVGDEQEWEYLLRSNDGRRMSVWSFAEGRWISSAHVAARGFDTLVLAWQGRTANEQIRWQASLKNSDDRWTLSRPRVLHVPHPPPALPEPWFQRERTGSEDPRWQRELRAAGVVADLDDDAIVVALDAGHGVESGAWDHGVREADSNLAFALRIEEILEARGVTVVQTRRSGGRPYLNLDRAFWRPDYQARAELAHLARADVFVSIHSNANYLFPINGLEAWYMPRWNGDGANLRLSETLLASVEEALAEYGYRTTSLTYDASCWEVVNGACDPIYVLAPFLQIDADAARRWGIDPAELGLSLDPYGAAENDWLWRNDITVGEPPIDLIQRETQIGPGKIVRGNLMPTTLLELLYVSHERDARILRDPAAREVIAQAVAAGILEFLGVGGQSE